MKFKVTHIHDLGYTKETVKDGVTMNEGEFFEYLGREVFGAANVTFGGVDSCRISGSYQTAGGDYAHSLDVISWEFITQ